MNLLHKWCDRTWLYAEYALGLVMLNVLIIGWTGFSDPQRIACLLCILLPAHVFEENTLPGGFFYGNNLRRGSDHPLMYPQNMLTNMITNLGAELFFIFLATKAHEWAYAIVTLAAIFGLMECLSHTTGGMRLHKKYQSKGKKTIYNPGLATSWLLLLQLSVYSIYWLCLRPFQAGGLLMGLAFLLVVVVCLILIPLAVSSRVKSRRFSFTDAGYYEKYIH